ncbi:hypothetical protein WN943_004734 [Citrus x changshan-huyou]
MTRVTRFANLYGLCDGLHGEPGAFVRALSLSCSKDVDVFLNFRGKCSAEAVNRGREQLIGNANGNAQQLDLDLSTCI